MTTNLASRLEGTRCRARLRLRSYVGLSALAGLCAGVVGIPILLAARADMIFGGTFWIMPVLFVVLGAPILGATNGALIGLLGYPLYRWITARVDVHTYSGEFVLVDRDVTKEI